MDYVKARSTDRMSESVAARDLSRKIRADITTELNNQSKQVRPHECPSLYSSDTFRGLPRFRSRPPIDHTTAPCRY